MERAILPISLIIPILNERKTLPALLAGIERQAGFPRELIFVDAGSCDGSCEIIRDWWNHVQVKTQRFCLLEKLGAFPGAGRNAGVLRAGEEWIAFLDGGIIPDHSWLKNLYRCAQDHQHSSLLGVCSFTAHGIIACAVCALSSGYGSFCPVLPASLFHRSVFNRIGLFIPELRAAEDIEWLQRLRMHDGDIPFCPDACVTYTFFPENFRKIMSKWFLYAHSAGKAGVKRVERIGYLSGSVLLLSSFLISWKYSVGAVMVAIGVRTVVFPMWRSRQIFWFKGDSRAAVIAPLLGVIMEISKCTGYWWFFLGSLGSRLRS